MLTKYSSENRRHSRHSAKVASPKKERSKYRSLLPLAVPFALNVIDALAEPEGGWESIPRKQDKKAQSKERPEERSERYVFTLFKLFDNSLRKFKSEERRDLREERMRRREFRKVERSEPAQSPPYKGKVMAEVEKLDNTIDAFTNRHKDGAKKKRLSRERRDKENEQREHEEALRNTGYAPRGRRSGSYETQGYAGPSSGYTIQRGRRRSGSSGNQGSGEPSSGYTVQRAGSVRANSGTPRAGKGETSYPPRVTRHLESPGPKSPYREDTHPSLPSMHDPPNRSLSRKHVRVIGERRNSGFGGNGLDDGSGSPQLTRNVSSGNRSVGAGTIDTLNDTLTEQAWEEMQREELEREELQRMGKMM